MIFEDTSVCSKILNDMQFSLYFSIIFKQFLYLLLGAFAKLRKANIWFVVFVRLSTWNNSAHTGRIFMTFCILVFF